MSGNLDDQTRSIIEKEIVEALSTYRQQFTLLIQIVTVLILANVSLIGFAITSDKPTLFYVAAVCPIIILLVKIKAGKLMLPVIYTAYHLEQKISDQNIDWLAKTFIETTFSGLVTDLKKLNELDDQQERINRLKKIGQKHHYILFNQSNLLVTLLCICTSAFEFFLPWITNSIG